MKNYLLHLFKSRLCIKIKGHNIERFIKRLKNNNINLINIKNISYNEINIEIYKKDFDKVIKLKTIYEIEILKTYGLENIKNNIFNNKYIIIFILMSLIVIYIITNMIFNIDVITNDSKMEKNIIEELEDLGIKKYKFKKSYEELQKIKSIILSKYRDTIEWIEIENIGTKYIIRYEPRIKNNIENNQELRNIVAKKDSVIKDLKISSGQIIKGVNSYVKKGDIIVSGYIDLNGNIKDTVSSSGIVYGEVWYNVKVTYPYKYKEIKETGNKKNILVIQILNKEIELFNFNKYKAKKTTNTTLLKNTILPIKIVYQHQKETIVINENNKENEAIDKAIKISKEKIETKLKEGEYISDYKVLNKIKNDDSITLNIFFSVIEDITEYQKIEQYQEELNKID